MKIHAATGKLEDDRDRMLDGVDALIGMFRRSGRTVARLIRNDNGQSSIELALSLPALLLVVTGIMAFGMTFNNYLALTEATAVGARQLAVSRGQTQDPCNTLVTAVEAAAPLLKPASLTFTISLNGTSYPGTTCAGTSTSGAPSNMILGTSASVMVTYPYSLSLYGIHMTSSVLTAQTTELMQ